MRRKCIHCLCYRGFYCQCIASGNIPLQKSFYYEAVDFIFITFVRKSNAHALKLIRRRATTDVRAASNSRSNND